MGAYVGNEYLRIWVYLNINITGASDLKIHYTKPSGTTGSWDATSGDDSNGYIYKDLTDGGDELDEDGWWLCYGKATFSDGRTSRGEVDKFFVRAEWDY